MEIFEGLTGEVRPRYYPPYQHFRRYFMMSVVIYFSGVPSSPQTSCGQRQFSNPPTREHEPDVFSTYTVGGKKNSFIVRAAVRAVALTHVLRLRCFWSIEALSAQKTYLCLFYNKLLLPVLVLKISAKLQWLRVLRHSHQNPKPPARAVLMFNCGIQISGNILMWYYVIYKMSGLSIKKIAI